MIPKTSLARGARLTAMALAVLLAASLASSATHAARIKDLGRLDGARKNQLIGYGLVVGLDGTGDTERASFTPQALEAMLSRLGVRVDKRQLSLRNVAAVTVTADLPAFARPGTQIDITVSSIGDARSLSSVRCRSSSGTTASSISRYNAPISAPRPISPTRSIALSPD